MKRNEFVQLKGLDLKELKLRSKTLREDIANVTLDKNMKKLKDLKTVQKKKKELAQVLTLMKQKELLGELESKVETKKSITAEVKEKSVKNEKGQK